MKYIERLLIAYILLKPFYIYSSGGLQIADIMLITAFITYAIITKYDKSKLETLIQTLKNNTKTNKSKPPAYCKHKHTQKTSRHGNAYPVKFMHLTHIHTHRHTITHTDTDTHTHAHTYFKRLSL